MTVLERIATHELERQRDKIKELEMSIDIIKRNFADVIKERDMWQKAFEALRNYIRKGASNET